VGTAGRTLNLMLEMPGAVLAALIVGYLPGALIFRLPGRSRALRASLSFEERAFWALLLSVLWSVMLVLTLGGLGRYTFTRLVTINLVSALVLIAAFRGRLRYPDRASRVSWTALVPVAIVAGGIWLYSPPSEYIIGGKDPGTYINEGIQIAQRGQVIVRDPDVASVPAVYRDLFFPSHQQATYYSLRLMGFFNQDPDAGSVVGQFPHFYPASIAIGYALNGLSGARQTVAFWTVLGLLAVYFTGRRMFGHAAAAAAALLLGLNVVEVWFGRYPNSEMTMQALIFAAFLAVGRIRDGGRVFFGIVAGAVLGLSLFLRYEILLAFAAFAAAGVMAPVSGRRLGAPFRLAVTLASAAGLWYLTGPMRAYFAYPIDFVHQRGGLWLGAAGLVAALAANWLVRRPPVHTLVRRFFPPALAMALVALAVFAYFFRHEGGRTALGDAMAFRTFGWYLTPWMLALAVAGAAVMTATRFWRDPEFYLTAATFSVFFFYKTRIVAEHFWTSRRFLGVALPAALLLAMAGTQWASGGDAGTADERATRRPRWREWVGLVTLALVALAAGVSFWRAATPVRHHVEYAGLIPKLEQLAARVGDRDLLLVESRNAGSDLHVLAMPLAYIYGRHVLVLDSVVPARASFEAFIAWAQTQYAHVYFLGGGGTDLLTKDISAVPMTGDRFQVDEYDAPMNAYPSGVRRKEFEYGLYQLMPTSQVPAAAIDLQMGGLDDLNVVRFHAREQRADTGMKYRWSGAQSFVVLLGLPSSAREIVVWMSSGGRPAQAPPPVVQFALDDEALGQATPVDEVRPYVLPLAPGLAARLAAKGDSVRLRLRVPTWSPGALLGVNDTRDLGVIVTRVQVR
jgi:4-amino-4-deoxy-L-arabinose transferase-like glycosyltransferase